MENPFYITGIIPETYFCDREKETTWMMPKHTSKSSLFIKI